MKHKDNIFSVDKAEDSTGLLLWQLTSLWQREIRKALDPFDLTHSQYVLLASTHWLSLQQQEVTQILLSQHTHIDPMTTSTVLRTLQAKNLLQRREHSTDSRAKSVALTPQGIEVIKKAVVAVEAFDHAFFSRLGAELPHFNRLALILLKEPYV